MSVIEELSGIGLEEADEFILSRLSIRDQPPGE
jgi:hypothetical protein